MKVVRTIVYDGPEDWLRTVLSLSLADGEHGVCGAGKTVTVQTIAHVLSPNEAKPEGIWPIGRPLDPRRKV